MAESGMAVHFSSVRLDWATPWDLYRELDEEFHFTVDVCATPQNAKHSVFYCADCDGLKQNWTGVCWMNPPYGREIGKWVKKAKESAEKGATVVCLLPARTDTKWFHDYCAGAEIRFLCGRVHFDGADNAAPFPSMIVIFRRK